MFRMATDETWVKLNPETQTFFHPDHGVLEGYAVHICEQKGGKRGTKK